MREQLGILRSLAIYYGQPWKYGRMQTFYRQFMGPGDLCFDVGAHVGNRLWIWSRLGARCVGIEPQPQCMALLRRWYGANAKIELVEAAVGAQPGRSTLHIDPGNPTVTTLSQEWIASMQQDNAFAGVAWNETVDVAVTTLDELIGTYGEPAFCKIDVEGYELEVLAGLSRPLPALSFEYMGATPDTTRACILRLADLGEYRFNWSPGESLHLAEAAWLTARELMDALPRVATAGSSGDIYARRVGGE